MAATLTELQEMLGVVVIPPRYGPRIAAEIRTIGRTPSSVKNPDGHRRPAPIRRNLAIWLGVGHSLNLLRRIEVGDNENRPLCVGEHRQRHAAEQDRLELREAARAQDDGRSVQFSGTVTDRPPRLPAQELSVGDEPRLAGQRETTVERVAPQFLKDLIDIKGPLGEPVKRHAEDRCRVVADEVFQSPASIVFVQAENRLHAIKALLVATIG